MVINVKKEKILTLLNKIIIDKNINTKNIVKLYKDIANLDYNNGIDNGIIKISLRNNKVSEMVHIEIDDDIAILLTEKGLIPLIIYIDNIIDTNQKTKILNKAQNVFAKMWIYIKAKSIFTKKK